MLRMEQPHTWILCFHGHFSARLLNNRRRHDSRRMVHTTQWPQEDGRWIRRIQMDFSQYFILDVLCQRTSSTALYQTQGRSCVKNIAIWVIWREWYCKWRSAAQPLIHMSFRWEFEPSIWISSVSKNNSPYPSAVGQTRAVTLSEMRGVWLETSSMSMLRF